ncbi:hypothetical protein IG631_14170 [Alternaria alternata]|nr:hypothetical protein IG631_14170 [Alternaria alternata]
MSNGSISSKKPENDDRTADKRLAGVTQFVTRCQKWRLLPTKNQHLLAYVTILCAIAIGRLIL